MSIKEVSRNGTKVSRVAYLCYRSVLKKTTVFQTLNIKHSSPYSIKVIGSKLVYNPTTFAFNTQSFSINENVVGL